MTVLLLAIMMVAFLGACKAGYDIWHLVDAGCAYPVGGICPTCGGTGLEDVHPNSPLWGSDCEDCKEEDDDE